MHAQYTIAQFFQVFGCLELPVSLSWHCNNRISLIEILLPLKQIKVVSNLLIKTVKQRDCSYKLTNWQKESKWKPNKIWGPQRWGEWVRRDMVRGRWESCMHSPQACGWVRGQVCRGCSLIHPGTVLCRGLGSVWLTPHVTLSAVEGGEVGSGLAVCGWRYGISLCMLGQF